MRLLTAGSLVRVQLGEPKQINPNFTPIGEGFGFFLFEHCMIIMAEAFNISAVTIIV